MHFLQILPTDPEAIAKADSLQAGWEKKITMLTQMDPKEAVAHIISELITVGLKILLALGIYLLGRWLIKRLLKFMNKVMVNRKIDVSLHAFLDSLVKITLYITLIVIIVGILGINTTSFIALFASAGLAIGMALSGTLQNFAGGVMILMVRPFRVGDFIEAQGQTGTVKAIQLTYTILNTPDNKTIYLPNGPVSTGIINNYSRERSRRVEWKFGIDYGNDFDYVRKTIQDLLDADPRIKTNKPTLVVLNGMGDSSIEIMVRGWASQKDYWDVYFEMNEKVFKVFSEKGILIPYPQMDVHLYKEDSAKEARLDQAPKLKKKKKAEEPKPEKE